MAKWVQAYRAKVEVGDTLLFDGEEVKVLSITRDRIWVTKGYALGWEKSSRIPLTKMLRVKDRDFYEALVKLED